MKRLLTLLLYPYMHSMSNCVLFCHMTMSDCVLFCHMAMLVLSPGGDRQLASCMCSRQATSSLATTLGGYGRHTLNDKVPPARSSMAAVKHDSLCMLAVVHSSYSALSL